MRLDEIIRRTVIIYICFTYEIRLSPRRRFESRTTRLRVDATWVSASASSEFENHCKACPTIRILESSTRHVLEYCKALSVRNIQCISTICIFKDNCHRRFEPQLSNAPRRNFARRCPTLPLPYSESVELQFNNPLLSALPRSPGSPNLFESASSGGSPPALFDIVDYAVREATCSTTPSPSHTPSSPCFHSPRTPPTTPESRRPGSTERACNHAQEWRKEHEHPSCSQRKAAGTLRFAGHLEGEQFEGREIIRGEVSEGGGTCAQQRCQ